MSECFQWWKIWNRNMNCWYWSEARFFYLTLYIGRWCIYVSLLKVSFIYVLNSPQTVSIVIFGYNNDYGIQPANFITGLERTLLLGRSLWQHITWFDVRSIGKGSSCLQVPFARIAFSWDWVGEITWCDVSNFVLSPALTRKSLCGL